MAACDLAVIFSTYNLLNTRSILWAGGALFKARFRIAKLGNYLASRAIFACRSVTVLVLAFRGTIIVITAR
jgi:hypothetical protein